MTRRQNKITITKTSFPELAQEITISNVDEMEIQADAIASLSSLKSIKLSNIGTLTFLPRSLVRNNESQPISVIIQDVITMQVHPDTFGVWRNSESKITIKGLDECNIETGAFPPNTTVESMQLENIKSLALKTGAFALSSSIQNAVVTRVPSLVMESGGIQADIFELTISNVFMETCEDNTFGSTIQVMSLASSQINLAKSGCISAGEGWKTLLVEHSKFGHIKPLAISGTIDQVQIKDSDIIGGVETEGFNLNVTRFSMERSSIGDVSEKALDVYAAEAIILDDCEIDILRKHAFSMLQLDPSTKEGILIQHLRVTDIENESMQFPDGTNLTVSHLTLGAPCTCDMENLALELGLPLQIHLGHGNGLKASSWYEQTRCASNTTTPTLAKYHREYCPDPTTTVPTTTSTSTTSSDTMKQRYVAQHWSDAGPGETGSVNTYVVIGAVVGALFIPAAMGVLLLVRRRRSTRSPPDREEQTEQPDSWETARGRAGGLGKPEKRRLVIEPETAV